MPFWEASNRGPGSAASRWNRIFVEAPSQMLEEWIQSPQVLASFARDYQSGKPIPADLVLRMKRASAFGRASYVGQQNGYTAVSYEIYDAKPQDVDLDAIANADAVKYTLFTTARGYSHVRLVRTPRGVLLRLLQPTCGTRSSPKTSSSNSTPEICSPAMRRCATGERCWNRAARYRRMIWSRTSWAAHSLWGHCSVGWPRNSTPNPADAGPSWARAPSGAPSGVCFGHPAFALTRAHPGPVALRAPLRASAPASCLRIERAPGAPISLHARLNQRPCRRGAKMCRRVLQEDYVHGQFPKQQRRFPGCSSGQPQRIHHAHLHSSSGGHPRIHPGRVGSVRVRPRGTDRAVHARLQLVPDTRRTSC